jgi:nucleotide-binding universal stress UspA family protein
MNNVTKVLFPVDFSKVSPVIAPWVLTIVEKFKAEIHLLFVVRSQGPLLSMEVSEISINTFEAEIIKAGENQMEKFVNDYFGAYPDIKPKVVVGDAAEEILHYITSEGIDMVVMGTHGRKGLDRIFFGSVANTVIKKAQAPVMSINPYRIASLKTEMEALAD